ncbi:MAG: BCCT family transporter [Nocardioides sp.]|nr:BCCT family transporter [Nocardioides sp.]
MTDSTSTKPREPGASRFKAIGGVHPPVFIPALLILAGVAGAGIFLPSQTESFLADAKVLAVDHVGWFLTLSVAVFVVFALWMGLSRFGDIKLGPDDEEADFSMPAWFAMLFAAGMGIGLVFWGVAEPLTYFGDVDRKAGMPGEGIELAQNSLAQVFVHWGFHAWAIYVVVGLALAYSIHRKGRPVSIRWALEPLLGDRVKGWLGDVIDVIAVVGTVVGVATSLGLGVQQISAGLVELNVFDEVTNPLLVGLIAVITCLATISVVSGVGKGIKWLSNANLVLAGVFMLTVLLLGPTLFLLRSWVQEIGVYLGSVLSLTFSSSAWTWGSGPGTGAGYTGGAWEAGWTIFYWGWWISWAPFVGVFIARISRGRTVRQFVAGVLLVPTLVTFLWFSILGGTALWQEIYGGGGVMDESDGVLSVNYDTALFRMLEHLPATGLLSGIAIILVAVFFITSSDSGSLVVTMLASGGDADPPTWSRVMWAVIEGLLAIGLLLAGGLTALQTGAILTSIPFVFIMLLMCWATYRALSAEHNVLVRAERRQRREELARVIGGEVTDDLTENFDEHFGDPVEQHVERHVEKVLADHEKNEHGGDGPA